MAEFSLQGKKIWVAGHNGLVGSALLRRLAREECEIITAAHDALDLTRQSDTEEWMAGHKPDAVILAAAKVGGIGENSGHPAEFIYQNLAIAQNVIHAAYRNNVRKLLFLGSSCIYPRMAAQPIPEDALLTGPLEPTNEAYAIAKIAGLKMAQFYRAQYECDFISAMPTNLYGPGDHFNARSSHVIPALMHKMHSAKMENNPSVDIWGSGKPMREFLHVDDLADALVFVLQHYSDAPPVNIGSGEEVSIAKLAEMVRDVCGYAGELVYDPLKPDGTPRKILDCSRLQTMGWRASIPLSQGLVETYEWYAQECCHNEAA